MCCAMYSKPKCSMAWCSARISGRHVRDTSVSSSCMNCSSTSSSQSQLAMCSSLGGDSCLPCPRSAAAAPPSRCAPRPAAASLPRRAASSCSLASRREMFSRHRAVRRISSSGRGGEPLAVDATFMW
eukprot:scaffold66968_cov57-Phaeocystis_antarctica.AAC.1